VRIIHIRRHPFLDMDMITKTKKTNKWRAVSDYVTTHPKARKIIALLLVISISFYSVPAGANVSKSFATTCLGDWQNPEKASGEPMFDESTSVEEYNQDNSAILIGEHGRMFCGGFASTLPEGSIIVSRSVRLSLAFKENEPQVEINDAYINDAGLLDGALSSTTESTSTEVITTPNTEAEVILIEPEPEPEQELDVEDAVESSNDATEVEVVPVESEPEVVPPTAEPEPSPTPEPEPEPEPVSFRWLIGDVAHAQETEEAVETTEIVETPEPEQSEQPVEPIIEEENIEETETVAPPEEVIVEPIEVEEVVEPIEEEIVIPEEAIIPSEEATTTLIEGEVAGTSTASTTIVSGVLPTEIIPKTLVISYSINGTDWFEIGQINQTDEGNMFSINLPGISESDIANLQLSVQALEAMSTVSDIYLDSIWLETEYNPPPEEKRNSKPIERVTYESSGFFLPQSLDGVKDLYHSSTPGTYCKIEPFSQIAILGDELKFIVMAPNNSYDPFRIRFGDLPIGLHISDESETPFEFDNKEGRKFNFSVSVEGDATHDESSMVLMYDTYSILEGKVETFECSFSIKVQ